MELVLGKKFKLEVWEVIVQKMSLNEVAKFTVHKTVSLSCPSLPTLVPPKHFPLHHAIPCNIPIGNVGELEQWKPAQLDQSKHFQRPEETFELFSTLIRYSSRQTDNCCG